MIMESKIKNPVNREVAEVELIYHNNVKPSLQPKITSSKDAYQILLQHWNTNKIEFVEQFNLMLLNRANRVLGIFEVSTGGIAGTAVDPKLVFTAALKSCSSGLILAHNHPSGNLTPSRADIRLTKKLCRGAGFLDIQVLDHLIVTPDGYYSFANQGLI